jgi:hypothetical protein
MQGMEYFATFLQHKPLFLIPMTQKLVPGLYPNIRLGNMARKNEE